MSEPEPSPVEGTSFRFRLLGSFAVFRNGVPLDAPEIGSRKGRTLLKLLLLERRHIVGNDRIAEVLWSDPVPDNADRLVATLVSRLRSVLGPDSVEGGPGGYRFAPGAGFEVDLDDAERFVGEAEARMDAGEPSLSVTAAQRALGLFEEGALLEDEPYAEWAEQARADAGRVLRRARRACWLAGLELGDAVAAFEAATAAVETNPLDEEAHRAVMLAHLRDGRPAQALEAFEKLRGVLADELGTDPAPETRALHLAILHEDSAAAETGAPAATKPSVRVSGEASDPGFVGRDEEISLLAGLWRDAARGHARLVLVAGEAGIGKTRLATEIVRVAESA